MFIDDVINFLSRLAFGESAGLVLTGIAPCMFLIRGIAASQHGRDEPPLP